MDVEMVMVMVIPSILCRNQLGLKENFLLGMVMGLSLAIDMVQSLVQASWRYW